MTLLRGPFLDALTNGHSTVIAANNFSTLDRERVHEDAFLRVATALEHFLTDWLVRSLADDPSYLHRRLSSAVRKDAVQRYVAGLELENEPKRILNAIGILSPRVTVEVPTRSKLRLQDARDIIETKGGALSMRSFEEHARLAEQLLAPSRKQYLLGLSQRDRDLVNLTIKLRHAIAHRSDRGADDLNEALQAQALRAQLRTGAQAGGRITAARIGRYLVARRGERTRSCWLLHDLAAMTYELAKTQGRHRVVCDCVQA